MEEFERVAAFQVRVGEPLGRGGVEPLSGEFSAEDPGCFVCLGFESEGLKSEADGERGKQQDEGSDEFGQIPVCVSGHGFRRVQSWSCFMARPMRLPRFSVDMYCWVSSNACASVMPAALSSL